MSITALTENGLERSNADRKAHFIFLALCARNALTSKRTLYLCLFAAFTGAAANGTRSDAPFLQTFSQRPNAAAGGDRSFALRAKQPPAAARR